MLSHTKFCGILAVAAIQTLALAKTPPPASVEKVALAGDDPIRIQIKTTAPVTPQVQVVTSPERLVIDLPNAAPGRALRSFSIDRGEVRGVRTSLFSQSPPTTRIVVDLNTPQWYRVTPDVGGFVVSLGGEAQGAADAHATVGWVSTKAPTSANKPRVLTAAVATKAVPQARQEQPVVNGVRVRFDGGELSIHASNATLSEVLFQIQKVTGAEIAIPAGTEEQRVAGDFGPGTASEVLGDLLNGSGLNFVVVGSPSDSTQLRSVLLSRKEGQADSPAAFAQQDAPPDAAQNDAPQNFDSDNSEPAPPPQEAAPQQNAQPENGGQPAGPPPG